MSNVSINKKSSGYVGGIVRLSNGASIRNSSVNNIQIVTTNNSNSIYIGGIVGEITNSTIENCYVKAISTNDEKAVSSAVGGIVANCVSSNNIKNCYTEGKINSVNRNVGGIVGNAGTINIENCYSKIDISTSNSNVGGILGTYSGNDISTITNNLSIGNIYTTSGMDSLNRVIGNNINTESNNYAYKNQLLNGYVQEEGKGATLLTKEEVLDLDLGSSYNISDKEKGILPKLYNTEETKLLPNQEDIYLEAETDVILEVGSIEATKPNTTEVNIKVQINNPEEIKITNLEIEDMNVGEVTRNVTQNGITSITVKAMPIRYYDSYKLTGIRYIIEEAQIERTKEVEVEIPVQFYKEIYTYEDWQSIEEGTYQNYRLMADIDFSGKTNIKNNITINRLEAENNIYTLKNIEITYNVANTGLIKNVKTSMKNIGFENITLTNNANSGNYFGVIASNNGDIENLIFRELTINSRGINYTGVIGGMTSGNIKNIELEDITINGNNYVGGLLRIHEYISCGRNKQYNWKQYYGSGQ